MTMESRVSSRALERTPGEELALLRETAERRGRDATYKALGPFLRTLSGDALGAMGPYLSEEARAALPVSVLRLFPEPQAEMGGASHADAVTPVVDAAAVFAQAMERFPAGFVKASLMGIEAHGAAHAPVEVAEEEFSIPSEIAPVFATYAALADALRGGENASAAAIPALARSLAFDLSHLSRHEEQLLEHAIRQHTV